MLPVLWLTYLLSFFAGVVRYFYILNPAAALPVLGKLSNAFWHFSSFLLLIYALYLAIYIWDYAQNRRMGKGRQLFYIVGVLSVITFFLANYLLGLELSNYGNYLYSSYGITKDSVFWLSNISLITMIIFGWFIYFNRKSLPVKNTRSNNKAVGYLVLGVLVWYSLFSVVKVSDYIWYARFDYSWVFENYNAIMELKSAVPEHGVVIIPIQSSNWPDISNGPIIRYFLFPRTIVSSSYLTNQERTHNFKEVYFIELSKKNQIWPIINDKSHTVNFGVSDLPYLELNKVDNNIDGQVFRVVFTK